LKHLPEQKMKMRLIHTFTCTTLAIASPLWLTAPRAAAADTKASRSTSARVIVNKDADPEEKVVVKVVTDEDEDARPAKERSWLGVGVEEASEALADQLGLDSGVGLVVTHVSADSPAAKAAVKKNDVLIELEGQSLVHPAQLRKLVQARKPGDKVKLVFYRGGKKHSESATIEQAPARLGLLDEGAGEDKVLRLHRERLELPHSEALRAQDKELRDFLRHIHGEAGHEVGTEIRRGMEQAHKAIADAAREVDHNKDSLPAESARLKELLKSGISVDDNATVVVRSKGKSSRSIVKTDDSGTIVVVGPPNLHLNAHDKRGKLIFDGEIETSDQRAKVPADVWKRVEPLLDETPH
jgi:membrane-associated protease RseP (regulator of RpoE activity)